MNETFKVSCPCGRHDFVFIRKPLRKVEMKCPECGQMNKYVPDELQSITLEEVGSLEDVLSKEKEDEE